MDEKNIVWDVTYRDNFYRAPRTKTVIYDSADEALEDMVKKTKGIWLVELVLKKEGKRDVSEKGS